MSCLTIRRWQKQIIILVLSDSENMLSVSNQKHSLVKRWSSAEPAKTTTKSLPCTAGARLQIAPLLRCSSYLHGSRHSDLSYPHRHHQPPRSKKQAAAALLAQASLFLRIPFHSLCPSLCILLSLFKSIEAFQSEVTFHREDNSTQS